MGYKGSMEPTVAATVWRRLADTMGKVRLLVLLCLLRFCVPAWITQPKPVNRKQFFTWYSMHIFLYLNQQWSKYPSTDPLPDHLLRGQKLPRSLLWVQQRMLRPAFPLQPLQLHQSGQRWLDGLWETQLHGLPVLPEEGRLSWLPALDGIQWLCAILPYDPYGEPHSDSFSGPYRCFYW